MSGEAPAHEPPRGIADIRATAARIGPHVRHTTTPRSGYLSALTGGEVH